MLIKLINEASQGRFGEEKAKETRVVAKSISEIGDINRFDGPSKLIAFAGLDVKG